MANGTDDTANPFAKYRRIAPPDTAPNPFAKYATQKPPPAKAKAPSLSEAIATGAQADYLSAPSVLPTAASVAQGALNLPEGIAQSVGIDLPGPLEAVRKEAKKAYMPGLGEFVGGLPYALFNPGAELGLLARTALSAGRGALGALFTPQEDAKTFWKGAGKRAAIGGAIGVPFGAFSAPVAQDAQHLLQNDIRVAPTAMVGGGRGVERLVSALPGFGPAIEHGAGITLGDYNRRLYRWALDGLGTSGRNIPLQAGSGGLSYVFNQITQRLNQANAALSLTPYATQGFSRDFLRVFQDARANMSTTAFQQFNRALQNYFVQPVLNGNGRLVGGALSKAVSDFSDLARGRMRGNNISPDDFALARAYRDVIGVMHQYSTGPQWARNMRDAARTAYAKYMVLEAGAGRAGVGAEGVISPRSFLAAEQANIGRGRFQRDEIPFQDAQDMKDLAEATHRVLGNRGYSSVVPALVGLEYVREGLPYMTKTLPALAAWWAAHTGPGMQAAATAAQSPLRTGFPMSLAQPAAAGEGGDNQLPVPGL